MNPPFPLPTLLRSGRGAPVLATAADQLSAERAGLLEFIEFVRGNKGIYRIIDEAEFVDPESFRAHYTTTAERITQRLVAAAERGEVRAGVEIGRAHV